jgi:PAS domain S-box-containing protein
MEIVDKRWYIGYSWFITIYTSVFLVLNILGAVGLFKNYTFFAAQGIPSYITIGLCIAVLLYRFLLFTRFKAKESLAYATLLYSFIQLTLLIHILHASDWAHSWFIILYFIIWGLIGMTGTFAIIGQGFLITLFGLMQLQTISKTGILDPQTGIVIGLSYLIVIANWIFWHAQFSSGESEQILSLKGEIVSKQKQAEILIQSIADGIVAINEKTEITLVNNKACEIVGWPQKEVLGFNGISVVNIMKDDKTLTSIDSAEHPFTKVLQSGKNFSGTIELLNREKNSRKFVSLVVSPVVSPVNAQLLVGAVAVLRDVSDEKQQERQRADFVSTASHEMRTPVAAIEGYLALAMNDKVSTIDNKARSYLEKAHSSTQHLGKLFQDLLTSAKAEDGRLTSHPEPVDMKNFVESLSQDLHFSAQKKGLSVELVVNTASTDTTTRSLQSLSPVYYTVVDPDRIREVVTNLFDNAVKYTDKGKITIGITGNDKIVQVFIKDTGPGIPKDDLPHLFQKFYRVDNSATRTIGGTGLGLFICKKIVELYGGVIWAESELGKGSSFFINLPRIDSLQAQKMISNNGIQALNQAKTIESIATK